MNKNRIALAISFLLFGSTIQAEVSELSPVEVESQQGEEATYNGVEILPSTSSLDTQSSQIQLNILELKGVAGTQGDPLGAVKSLPGIVSADGGGGKTPGFFVRGSGADENAVYVDGLPLGYIYHFGGIYSVLNPDMIDNFSTYLGGFGVEFADRLGGVVDIQTRKPNEERLTQSYQIGTYDASARVEGPVSDFGSAFFAVRRSYIDFILPYVTDLSQDGNTIQQVPYFYDFQGKYRHKLDKGFFEVALYYAYDTLKFKLGDEETELQDPALLGSLGSTQSSQTLGFRWNERVNNQIEQKVRFGVLTQENKFIIGTQQSYDPNPGESYGFDLRGSTYFFWPKWEVSQGDNLWTVGADFTRYDFKLDGYIGAPCREGEPDCNVSESSAADIGQKFTGYGADAYVQLKRPLTDRLFMKAGVRQSNYDYAADPYHEVSPRISLEYDLNDSTILTATWGRYVQTPQGDEISKTLGNEDLVMTEAEHRVLGIKNEWNELWSSQIEVYQKPMKKLVVSRPAPENYANEGIGEAKGLDILIKRKMADRTYGWLTYSYLESTREDTGDDSQRLFDGDVPHTLNLIWSQPFSGSWANWVWGMNLKMQSGDPYTDVVGREYISVPNEGNTCDQNNPSDGCYWNPIYGKTNGKRLPMSTRLDLSMEKTIKYTGWDLQIRYELLNVSAVLYPAGNIEGYEYEEDYRDYDNPKAVSGFPFIPSFSVRGNF